MKAIDYINKKEFEISGIINWHKQGYTGKGVKIANIEKCNTNVWYLKKTVNDPFLNAKQEKENSHGNQTLNMISQVAPDADFYTLPRGGIYVKDNATGEFIENSLPYIISEGICLVNASFGGVDNKILNEAILNVQKHGTAFICSAGNSGDRGASPYAKSGVWIAVGAVVLNTREEIKLTTYSSVDEAVDFVQFSETYVNDVRDDYRDRLIHCGGTSFSSPLLTGMLALVQQFFKGITGQYLKQNELYQFMMDNSVDLGDEGKDTKYGHGLFVLPNPDDIDVSKYAELPIEGGDNMETFPDLDGHWGEKYVRHWVEKGLFDGYEDGTIKPDRSLTRAELAKVLYYYDKLRGGIR